MLDSALQQKLPWYSLPFLKLNSFLMQTAPQAGAAAAHISNLGSSKLESSSDTLRVEGYRTLLCASGVGRSAIVNCNTYQDRSTITVTYSKLHVSDDEAATLLSRIVENLITMASDESVR